MNNLCRFIIYYEHLVWSYLSKVFGYHLKGSEIGFTYDLIFKLTEYSYKNKSLEVYITDHKIREKYTGADIDLYIQIKKGWYSYFKIQAKIMNYRGIYYDISKWGVNAQYNKLIKTCRQQNAFPLYLFYNGKTKNSRTNPSNKWGLSIIDANEINSYRFQQWKSNKRRIKRLTYDMLYPKSMKPFHTLFCGGNTGFEMPKLTPLSEIYTGFPYIRALAEPQNDGESIEVNEEFENDEQFREAENIFKERKLAPIRLIINSDIEQNS